MQERTRDHGTLACGRVSGLIVVLVYERLGLRLLQRWWLNLDRVWALALIGTAALTVLAG